MGTDCIRTFNPQNTSAEVSIHGLSLLPKQGDRVVICSLSPTLHVTSFAGDVIQTYTSPGSDLLQYVCSPKGNFVYAVGDDKILYCFNAENGKIEHVVKTH